MKRTLLGLVLVLLALVSFVLVNTFTFASSQMEVDGVDRVPNPPNAIERFVEAISIRTVSFEDPADFDSSQFFLFNEFMERSYPLMHEQLDHEVFNDFSHLYTWKGSDESLKPIVLMGHIDVVPIASPYKWSVHPFREGVKDGVVYGRGTIDDKIAVISTMEAVEQMLSEGYQPRRTIYLSYGHDEEVSGEMGAVASVNYLKEQGIEAEFVLDEGGAIVEDVFPGIDRPIAVIGIAEKGYLSLELSVDMNGGHSSAPEHESSIDVLSRAIYMIKDNPMPARITPVLHAFMDKLGPEMSALTRIAFANRSLFSSKIFEILNSSKAGNAFIRTTTAPTIFESGIKDNVIPTSARAVVNFRILPGDTPVDIMRHLTEVIDDDRVRIEAVSETTLASHISPVDVDGYHIVERSIKELYPDVLVSPYLVLGATDSRHFSPISKNIYRFLPYTIDKDNLDCFHGVDERVGVEEFYDAIRFYRRVILNSNELKLPS